MDALYANEGVFKLCEQHKCAYLITFKQGSLPATWKEYQTLKGLAPNQRRQDSNGTQTLEFHWANEIDYGNAGLKVSSFGRRLCPVDVKS